MSALDLAILGTAAPLRTDRRLAWLRVSPTFVLGLLRAGDPHRWFQVERSDVPEDAEIVQVAYDVERGEFCYLLRSDAFPESSEGVVPFFTAGVAFRSLVQSEEVSP